MKNFHLNKKVITVIILYAFLWRLKIHTFNYMIITCGYFGLRRWNKNHRAQDELVNPFIYKFIPKYKC